MTKKLVPPDGGYGWVIVGALSCHHFIMHSMSQIFGLMFKELFKELGFSAMDISFIMNVNSGLALGLGIVNGILVRSLGYRKVALLGAILVTAGAALTAYATSFTHYVLSYGVITAVGAGLTSSSHSFALNNYFSKKLAKAVSYTFTICGFGPLLLPLVFSFLIEGYGARGSALLFVGLVAHLFVTSLLLQPIKWHMKEELVVEEKEYENLLHQDNKDKENYRSKSKLPANDDVHYQSTYDLDTSLGASLLSLCNETIEKRRPSRVSVNSRTIATYLKDEKSTTIKIPKEDELTEKKTSEDKDFDTNIKKNENNESLMKKMKQNIINIFDLELLRDTTFLNMATGMSIAAFAEINFAQLTPFLMQDFGLNTQEIATFLAVQAVTDICFRFIAPYVSDLCNMSVRVMYLWSLGLLILSRCSLLFTSDYYPLLGCGVFLGLARGFRTIYWTLVMPSYVPVERLPSAGGLQSIFSCLLMWTGGPLLGYIKDKLASPFKCIIVVNLISSICIFTWSTEFIYKRYKSRRKGTESDGNMI